MVKQIKKFKNQLKVTSLASGEAKTENPDSLSQDPAQGLPSTPALQIPCGWDPHPKQL